MGIEVSLTYKGHKGGQPPFGLILKLQSLLAL